MSTNVDVAILGGGLAGLTLALQLRRADPGISVLVLERDAHPPPMAAHKVGESTVEIGAFYLRETLGLGDHLRTDQLRKFGLRFFIRSDAASEDLNDRVEVGGTVYLPFESYQLDRGRLEAHLGQAVLARGGRFVDSAAVRSVVLDGQAGHRITYVRGGEQEEVLARWVIDASGRREIIKRQLNLAKPTGHRASAAWFRFSVELNIDDWSTADGWRQGHEQKHFSRWFSTNHLMGKGYWVWVIPLSHGATSVGIVTDETIHPLSTYSTLERAIEWLDEHEPLCAARVREHREHILDFKALRNYARNAERVFSPDRWCISGEAGLFLDPFYSPGSDFIAMGNTFICDLVMRDRAGEPIAQRARIYDELYRGYGQHSFVVYEGQYEVFGDPVVMPIKVIWDFAMYWVLFAFVFCQGRLCDLSALQSLRVDLDTVARLNREMQALFLAWHREGPPPPPPGRIELPGIPFLRALNAGLTAPLSSAEFRAKLAENIELLEALAEEIQAAANGGERETSELLMPEVWNRLGLPV